MNSIATSRGTAPGSQAPLRLVKDGVGPIAIPRQSERRLELELSNMDVGPGPVLVVGADTSTRSQMLAELRNVLPTGTHFLEAQETWEVLARAAGSQMVVLVGDLGEVSSGSLVRLLARRQPSLPVLVVGSIAPAHAGAASL